MFFLSCSVILTICLVGCFAFLYTQTVIDGRVIEYCFVGEM